MFVFHQEDIQTLEEYLHPFPRMEDIFRVGTVVAGSAFPAAGFH